MIWLVALAAFIIGFILGAAGMAAWVAESLAEDHKE